MRPWGIHFPSPLWCLYLLEPENLLPLEEPWELEDLDLEVCEWYLDLPLPLEPLLLLPFPFPDAEDLPPDDPLLGLLGDENLGFNLQSLA